VVPPPGRDRDPGIPSPRNGNPVGRPGPAQAPSPDYPPPESTIACGVGQAPWHSVPAGTELGWRSWHSSELHSCTKGAARLSACLVARSCISENKLQADKIDCVEHLERELPRPTDFGQRRGLGHCDRC